jgi:hypothetical protein
MRYRKNFGFWVFVVLLLVSCTTKDKEGDWDDNIKLSGRTFEIGASADSVIVTTGGSSWWINNVSVNGDSYYALSSDFSVSGYKIQHDCYIVERRNKNTLFVKVAENTGAVKRTIVVGLQAGDYFDSVTIIQKPK